MSIRQMIPLQVAYAVAAPLLLLLAHIEGPPYRLGQAAAGGVGVGAAAVLSFALVRTPAAQPRRLLLPALGAAFTEEVVWRWGVLAGTAPLFGWSGALALSTFGFAYRHTRSEGLVLYLVLGGALGGVFLATGRLLAAVAAHATYNALVLLRGRA